MSSTVSSDMKSLNNAEADGELPNANTECKSDVPEITDEAVRAWIQHEIGDPRPDIPRLVVPDIAPSEIDEAIAARLIASYNACKKEEAAYPAIGADIWSAIRGLQARFFTILESGDPKALAAYLCNMSRHDATIGISQGDGEYRWITTSPEYEYFRALLIKDKLVSFAEAVGAIRCECPEQGPWGEHLNADIDVLLHALEECVGISLAPPEIDGGLFKIPAGSGLLHDRDLHAQFAAWSMREIAGPNATICEIGGGVGRAAYWAQRFGLGPYTILDRPHVNVLQAYYLLKSLPMDQVRLFGETLDNPRVTVWPYFEKRRITPDAVDIVFNQDSLPEIHRDAALDYIAWARQISPRWFYSINQEAAVAYTQNFGEPAGESDPKQNVVGALVTEAHGFRRVMRAPYWLRKGYTSELYQILRKPSEGTIAASSESAI
jgi:hypothetical protein